MSVPGKREPMLLTIGYAALLAVFVTAMIDREPYDDSFFFKRVALNALDHGTLAWNVTGGRLPFRSRRTEPPVPARYSD